jgi:hypothetical protein
MIARVVSIAAFLLAIVEPLGLRAQTPATPISIRGQTLAIGHGYVIFTTGTTVRMREGTLVPRGTTLGSTIRVRLDRATGEVVAIELDPKDIRDDDVDAARVPAPFAVSGLTALGASATTTAETAAPVRAEAAVVNLAVTVPANTPPNDDVYVATNRSNFSPSEIRMQRTSARRFTVSLSLPRDSKLRYQFTRGSFATVERNRSGGIVEPHVLAVGSEATVETIVERFADLN